MSAELIAILAIGAGMVATFLTFAGLMLTLINQANKESASERSALEDQMNRGFEQLRNDMNRGFEQLRNEMTQESDSLRTEMTQESDSLRAEMNRASPSCVPR